MFEPWKCPDCATWLAPGVTQHRCDDPPAAGVARRPIPPPGPIVTTIGTGWQTCRCCGAQLVGWHQCAAPYPTWIGWPLPGTQSAGYGFTGDTSLMIGDSTEIAG